MKNRASFSFKARAASIRYAWQGLAAFFNEQHNAIIHLGFTLAVFLAAIYLKIEGTELVALLLATGFVWSAEIFNTAIEAVMDHLSPAKHPKVKFIKDVAAAAVLIAAVTAAIVGLLIFIPKII
jgi:diacylglycerol kinase (ATP)